MSAKPTSNGALLVFAVIAGAAVGIGFVAGWIMNIIKLVSILSDPLTAFHVLRIIGIPFAPLGAVLGWL